MNATETERERELDRLQVVYWPSRSVLAERYDQWCRVIASVPGRRAAMAGYDPEDRIGPANSPEGMVWRTDIFGQTVGDWTPAGVQDCDRLADGSVGPRTCQRNGFGGERYFVGVQHSYAVGTPVSVVLSDLQVVAASRPDDVIAASIRESNEAAEATAASFGY